MNMIQALNLFLPILLFTEGVEKLQGIEGWNIFKINLLQVVNTLKEA